MKEKEITGHSKVPAGTMVYGDRNMINTVIRNLISNAVKYTEKGKIEVNYKADERAITFSIKDTGVGMPDERAKTLFEIGGSKSTEGTRGEAGTGLGLIICKEFVEKMGGRIAVESEPGKGSVFYFSIPNQA